MIFQRQNDAQNGAKSTKGISDLSRLAWSSHYCCQLHEEIPLIPKAFKRKFTSSYESLLRNFVSSGPSDPMSVMTVL
ncbi:MAG: hypothetical protein ACLPVO_01740 [Desulfomonilaceae bacterium]